MAGMLKFNNEDIEKILLSNAFKQIAKAPERNRALFAVQLCLGPRINEMLRLTLGDVLDIHGKIKNEIIFKKTKNGKPRTVKAINPLLFIFLPAWLEKLTEMGYMQANSPLFPGRGKVKALTAHRVRDIYQAAIDEIAAKSEDPLRFKEKHSTHSCRKTWACQTFDWLCEERRKGANIEPLRELQNIGGWETLEATARYIDDHISRANESQAAIYADLVANLRKNPEVHLLTNDTK